MQMSKAAQGLSLWDSMLALVSYTVPRAAVATNVLMIDIAYFMICMGILCFVYLICSIRTNLIFFLIFFTLVPAFGLLAGAFLNAAQGKASIAAKCQEAAGAFTFVTCLLGWYILLAIMLASVDFPFDLPRKFLPSMLQNG
jgi:succinate-acetate transporter protein